jgi:hypothetical protein
VVVANLEYLTYRVAYFILNCGGFKLKDSPETGISA